MRVADIATEARKRRRSLPTTDVLLLGLDPSTAGAYVAVL
jgi:hypothetical protein